MSEDARNEIRSSGDSGVADVRLVREKIAAQYDGDLRRHVADTDQLVEPLIQKLGLKRGVPPEAMTDDRARKGKALKPSVGRCLLPRRVKVEPASDNQS